MDPQAAVIIDAIILASSSSSSSDSDIDNEIDLILNENERGNQNENRRPGVQFFIETVIYRYTEQEFQENYRMNRTIFYYLLHLIRPDLEGIRFGRLSIPPEKQLFIALCVLGSTDSNRSVTTKFDIRKATAGRSVNRVVRAICEYRNYFISWPSQNEAIATSNRIEARYGFPKVLGAVDGTHIQIPAPKRDAQSYINRKCVHSIQLQVICNDKLQFIHCYVGLPGSVHDIRVFKYSGVQQKCNAEYFPQNSHILGDSAYTIQNHVLVPYRDDGHLTLEQVYFNI